MKIFTVLDYDVHDHLILLITFIVFVLVLVYNDHYVNTKNCLLLEPTSTCIQISNATREQIIANSSEYQYIPYYLNYNGNDAYREKMQYGFQIYYCLPSSDVCQGHYDSFNAVDFPFGMVAHISDFLVSDENTCDVSQPGVDLRDKGSSCFDFPDYLVSIAIWAVAFAIIYYLILRPFVVKRLLDE